MSALSRIIFSGTEVPSNRTLLERAGATNVMFNYWGAYKRGLPKHKLYLLNEHFLPDMKIWVDSGAAQADKANLSRRELEEFAADYEEFIAVNHDRIEGWVEFDSQVLGMPWIQHQRDALGFDAKRIVVWHETYNPLLLQQWASQHDQIAISGSAIDKVPSLAGITRNMKAMHGTTILALGTAKPDNLRQIPFDSVSTLSWLSPMRRGETIIWDGMKLVRYQKKMKDQARPRYKRIVEQAGLDFQKFLDDDTLEATKVAVWSYLQLEANTRNKRPDLKLIQGSKEEPMVSDNNDDTLYTGLMDFHGGGSNNSGSEMRKVERQEVVQRDPSEVVSMPVFGYEMKTVIGTDNGQDILAEVPTVKSNTNSLRQCDTCFVAANCPAFKPANTCAFNLPIKVETPEQLRAMNTALLEMQAQRVAFMRFSEELNGGYADPNVSQEMDRYFKMLKSMKDLDESKEFIQITAQRNAGQGVLSAIFGDRVNAMKERQQGLSEEQTTMIIQQKIEE